MARPPRYDSALLLDAAVALAARGGPPAVTMSAVAKEVGAPSGSVYHRFPQRPALLAEVWLRTVERFQEGFLAALAVLAADDCPPATLRAAALAAARHVVSWSRAHPDEAAVLLHGARDFGRAEWPDAYVRRADEGNARVMSAVAEVARRLGARRPVDAERVVLAVVDLPYAVVRRALREGDGLPPHAEDLVVRSADALLPQGAEAATA
ncbi:TetR/AcrR family transcriptional regulator [Streptomyces sp. URMC 123]|uniref:TetR/AcrR family transcriptional regulator n=1 Tax=Streptomyces sp. URMC 123 TaxID=3423403 RepID=UPI003F1A0AB6